MQLFPNEKGGCGMEKVIEKLAEIEKSANKILETTNEYKKQLDDEAQAQILSDQEAIKSEFQEKLLVLQREFEEEIELETDKIHKETQIRLNDMNNSYSSHLNDMVDKIFQQIIEV